MTYLEAVEAGKAEVKSEEVLLRVVREGDDWVAVICHSVVVRPNFVGEDEIVKRLVRKEVVGCLS